PGILCRGTVGHGGILETPPRQPPLAVLLLLRWAGVPWTPGLLAALAHSAKLDCAGGAADVLPDGGLLGRALARGRTLGQELAAGRVAVRLGGGWGAAPEQCHRHDRRPSVAGGDGPVTARTGLEGDDGGGRTGAPEAARGG